MNCLEEMGDIAPALETLLMLQAKYARQDGVSRAQRDVARKALEAEINRYIARSPLVHALRRIARWHGEFPPSDRYFPVTTNGEKTEMSYGTAFGSNGERDYMRQVALNALNGYDAAHGEGQ